MPRNYLKEEFGFSPQNKEAPAWARIANRMHRNQKTRCTNKKVSHYQWYGGRGVSVEYSLVEFLHWFRQNVSDEVLADHLSGKRRISVGRIDHSRNYSLDNIHVETISENSKERIRRSGFTTPPRKVIASSGMLRCRISFESLRAASRHFNVHHHQITQWAKNGRGPAGTDYKFTVVPR